MFNYLLLEIYTWEKEPRWKNPRWFRTCSIWHGLQLEVTIMMKFAEYFPRAIYGKPNMTEPWKMNVISLDHSQRSLLTAGRDQPRRTPLSCTWFESSSSILQVLLSSQTWHCFLHPYGQLIILLSISLRETQL